MEKFATEAESHVFDRVLAELVNGNSGPHISLDMVERAEGLVSLVWTTSYGKVRVNIEINEIPQSPRSNTG